MFKKIREMIDEHNKKKLEEKRKQQEREERARARRELRKKRRSEPGEVRGFMKAVPVVLFAVALFITLCYVSGDVGTFGSFIAKALFGLFSYMAYTVPAFLVIHAVLYYRDVRDHKVGKRIILSLIAIITLSEIAYIIPNFNKEPIFDAASFYNLGTELNGGGFIGGAFGYATESVIGKYGLIIVILLTVILFAIYFFQGGGAKISRFFLRRLGKIANFGADIERKKREKKKKLKAERLEKARANDDKKNADLYNDEFFYADNGVSHLEIPELGIVETKNALDGSNILRENVIKEESEPKAQVKEEPEVEEAREKPKHRKLDFDIDLTDDHSPIKKDKTFRDDDIVYEYEEEPEEKVPEVKKTAKDYGIDDSAEAVFNSSSFDPFNIALNEKLAEKQSSRAAEIKKPAQGGFSEYVHDLTAEQMAEIERVKAFEKSREEALRRREAAEARMREEEESKRREEEEAKRREAENAVHYAPHQDPISDTSAHTSSPSYSPAFTSSEPTAAQAPNPRAYEPAPEVRISYSDGGEKAPSRVGSYEQIRNISSINSEYEQQYGQPQRASAERSSNFSFVGSTVDEPRRQYASSDGVYRAEEVRKETVSIPRDEPRRSGIDFTVEEPRYANASTEKPYSSSLSESSTQPISDTVSRQGYVNSFDLYHSTEDETEENDLTTEPEVKVNAPESTPKTFQYEDRSGADTRYAQQSDSTTRLGGDHAPGGSDTSQANEASAPSYASALSERPTFEKTLDLDEEEEPSEEIPVFPSRTELYESTSNEDGTQRRDISEGEVMEISRSRLNDELSRGDGEKKSGLDFSVSDDDDDDGECAPEDTEPEEQIEKELIPESERNPMISEYRNMFTVLDNGDGNKNAENGTEASLGANAPAEVAPELTEPEASVPDIEDIATAAVEAEDELPFEIEEEKEEEPKAPPRPDYSSYKFPPLEMLNKGKEENTEQIKEEISLAGEKLISTLESFNIRATIRGIERGPRITRYSIVPAKGVRVSQIEKLSDDIALAMAAESIRIEAPIPGKSAVGIEVPNKVPSIVSLRDLLESDEFINETSKTTVCIGKSVEGTHVFGDIGTMPHLLIAGATGMGKSVCMNALITSILYKARPDEVKFIMIDPKKVEFAPYNGIPHLLVPVVTDPKQAAGALLWAVDEMNKRYDIIGKLSVKGIDSYNTKVAENPELGAPMPKIVIFIDELNDLMIQVRDPVENLIMLIAQKARAAGIHLVIGTQRPSVNVITGVIKANIPSRIACKVSSGIDSRTILEQTGAEKLIGKGDMLFAPGGKPNPLRVQGAFVSEQEASNIVEFIKAQAQGELYDEQALEDMKRAAQKCDKGRGDDGMDDDDDDGEYGVGYLHDRKFLNAVELAIRNGSVATSFLQRKLHIGYGKAAQYIDIMEELGVVGEKNGSKARDVLIDLNEWNEMLARRTDD